VKAQTPFTSLHARRPRAKPALATAVAVLLLLLGSALAATNIDRLLWIHAGAGDAEKVREDLQRGADPDSLTPGGKPVLETAVDLRRIEVVRVLLEAGANPNPPPGHYTTPLFQAVARQPGSGLAELFLRYGADPNGVFASTKETPLFPAIGQGALALVRLLLEYGADVNHQDRLGNTPLITASDVGNAAIAKLLLERGADASLKDKYGFTATSLALQRRGRLQVAYVLLDYGADVSNGDFLSAALRWKDHALLKKLIAKGINVNRSPGREVTALGLAVHYDDAEALRILLEAGADPRIADADGETAYAQAIRRQRHEIVKVFNQYGVMN